IALDPALGNAWLGGGLSRRRLGWLGGNVAGSGQGPAQTGDWLSDLQTAAALEPRRSVVRSYAGKAFSEVGEERLAKKEFAYAKPSASRNTADSSKPTTLDFSPAPNIAAMASSAKSPRRAASLAARATPSTSTISTMKAPAPTMT